MDGSIEMKFAFYLFLAGVFFSISSSGQMVYSLGDDSAYMQQLENEAVSATDDSTAAVTYFKLSLLHKRKGDLANAKKTLEEGLARTVSSSFLKAASIYYETIVQHLGVDMKLLEENLLKADSALTPFTQPEADRLRAMIWNTYGTIQQIKGDEKEAMNVFTKKAAHFADRSGDLLMQGKASKSIAIVFMNVNQRGKAAPYLLRAISNIEKAPVSPVQKVDLLETYVIAAENYVFHESYDSAKWLLDKARKVLAPYPNANVYLIYYFAEGSYFDKIHQYASANESFEKGIAMAEKLGAGHSLNRLKYARYKTLSSQKQYQQAAEVLLDLLESPLVFTTDKKIYYNDLYTTYSKLNNTKEAFHWAQKYIVLSDSLHDVKLQKDIIELEEKYNESEHLKKIAVLNAEKDKAALESKNAKLLLGLLGTVSITLLISVVSGIFLYRNSRKLSLQKQLQYQQQLNDVQQRQQIQVTKALMQGEETERKRLAVDLHDGLGSRLAGVKIRLSQLATIPSNIDQELALVIEQLDVSSNELRRIARNLMPEVLLQLGLEPALKDMCDSLSTETTIVEFQPFGISKSIAEDIQVNIYRIVQELLLNAVRHANASQILVQCSQNESMFFITLEDNGQGFETENYKSNGIGLGNIRKRVEYLKGKLEITSEPNEGTTINIEFDVTQS